MGDEVTGRKDILGVVFCHLFNIVHDLKDIRRT